MLPLLQREVVDRHGWATEDEILDYFAIGQCTPGIIFVNVATFVGYKRKGVLGAIAATAGSICPSLIIITIIAAALQNFADLPVIQHAFGAVRVVVGVLIANAVVMTWKKSVVDKLCAVVAIVAFVLSGVLSFSPVPIIIGAGAFGILASSWKEAKR